MCIICIIISAARNMTIFGQCINLTQFLKAIITDKFSMMHCILVNLNLLSILTYEDISFHQVEF